jgi:DNA-binding NarL/FixJ family response regulator
MSSANTCVVADDHPAVLESVSRYLGIKGFLVVGRARNGEEAIALVESLRPALALLDLRMPLLGGTGAVRRLARSVPQCSAVAYSGYADRALLTEALDAGARGFVLKEAPLAEVIRAVELVAAGRTYVDPVLAGVISMSAITGKPLTVTLTQRERDVLRLLADGRSNEEIGAELSISPETVRTHLRKAMAKLEADTRTQAVATALRQSLIA